MRFASLLALTFVLFGCAAEPGPMPGASASEALRPVGDYYSLRPDYRRCIAPLCGGVWVSRVNSDTTRCPDGSDAAECYVADVDWSALGLPSSQESSLNAQVGRLLVTGRLRRRHDRNFGHLGQLDVTQAWRAPSDVVASGTFYGLHDNGIVCFTAPCFSVEATLLNDGSTQTLSDLDLSAVGASDAERVAAYEAMRGGTLRVAGTVGPSSTGGTGLVASAFYLPVEAQECGADAECGLSVYHSYVQNRSECYCTFCPQPISSADAAINEASWQRHCSGIGMACPVVRCLDPGAPYCNAGTCEAR